VKVHLSICAHNFYTVIIDSYTYVVVIIVFHYIMCFAKPSDEFKASNLHQNIDHWKQIGAPSNVINWLENGVLIPFDQEPQSFYLPNRKFGFTKGEFIADEIASLLKSGAIREVNEPPTCISPISCVPKKGGKFRLIVDLRIINQSCVVPKFRYEDINAQLLITFNHMTN